MENRVLTEVEKYKVVLKKALTGRFGDKLSPDDADFVINLISDTASRLIQLMREGKSAHEKFFSDIILNSIDAILGFDNENKIFLWNKGAENIFGYSKEEVMGRDFSFLLPEYRIKTREIEYMEEQIKANGYFVNYETDRITKNGEIINVSITRYLIHDENNEPIGSVGIIRDVTHVKKLEKELREKENLALIGEVVSSIAHSLSNPLNIISGTADYLLLDKKPSDEDYGDLKTIVDEATRITKAIRQLLNFSRPLKTVKQPVSINDIIEEVIAKLKFSTGKKNITFKNYLNSDIPKINCDPAQIQETISNLLTNAIQAIGDKGEIKVKTSSKNGTVDIEISDTGIGISKDNIDKIFEPFFSSKEYGKGTGLGLSIARRIMKEHNGEISVKSIRGRGTTFTLKLPVQ
jgi:PAS domain S-box-containing protein